MNNSALFYQTFYQNETLFRIDEPAVVTEEKVSEPEVRQETPVSTVEKIPVPEEKEKPAVVEADEPQPASVPAAIPSPPPVVPFPTLQHRVLVLIDEKKQELPDPSDALLLEKILKATGHDPAETDLLNFSHLPQTDARTVLAQKSTNYFISFGVPLIKLKLDLLLPPYTPKQIEGIWFLLAEPLSVIDADQERKKRLWLALKKMFAVS